MSPAIAVDRPDVPSLASIGAKSAKRSASTRPRRMARSSSTTRTVARVMRAPYPAARTSLPEVVPLAADLRFLARLERHRPLRLAGAVEVQRPPAPEPRERSPGVGAAFHHDFVGVRVELTLAAAFAHFVEPAEHVAADLHAHRFAAAVDDLDAAGEVDARVVRAAPDQRAALATGFLGGRLHQQVDGSRQR